MFPLMSKIRMTLQTLEYEIKPVHKSQQVQMLLHLNAWSAWSAWRDAPNLHLEIIQQ